MALPKFRFALTEDTPIDLVIADLCNITIASDSHYKDSPRGLCHVKIPGWEIFSEFIPGPEVPLLQWMRVIKGSEGQVLFYWVNKKTIKGEFEITNRDILSELNKAIQQKLDSLK